MRILGLDVSVSESGYKVAYAVYSNKYNDIMCTKIKKYSFIGEVVKDVLSIAMKSGCRRIAFAGYGIEYLLKIELKRLLDEDIILDYNLALSDVHYILCKYPRVKSYIHDTLDCEFEIKNGCISVKPSDTVGYKMAMAIIQSVK